MPKVVVIGGANVDIKGRASSAFVGATSNPGEVTISVGGVARNIAENLARLGVEASLMTVLGDDANGRLIRDVTSAAGVDLSLTLTGSEATGTYLVILDHKGELQSAVNEMRAIESLKSKHLEAVADRLGAADVLVADCNIDVSCLDWLCAFSARTAIRLLIDPVSVPKAKKLLKYHRSNPVFAITPNKDQLGALTGESDLDRAVARLHDLGFANVVVHLGADGALASASGKTSRIAAFPVAEIADVTGAGDAAVSGLILGLLDGLPFEPAARLGQAAAAIKLTSPQSVANGLTRDRVLSLAGTA